MAKKPAAKPAPRVAPMKPADAKDLTAKTFTAKLKTFQSDAELQKIQRYFKSGEGQYGHGDTFIGVRMGTLFAVAKAFVAMSPAEIEKLLESDIHEVRAGALSIMGQQFYRPPNVSGWDGGLAWINNSTVNVRRVLVETLFLPLDEANLNADEKKLLDADRAEGKRTYSITSDKLESYAQRKDEDIVTHLCDYFLPVQPAQGFRDAMLAILGDAKVPRQQRVRQVILAVLQSPYYQVC